jgi:hypothetical protein
MASHPKTNLLILGAGWTSTFLIPLCREQGISYTATSREGRDGTVPFLFDPESENSDAYKPLPVAENVLITFPIKTKGASERLVRLYKATHGGDSVDVRFIQLGTTSIWGVSADLSTHTILEYCSDSTFREVWGTSLCGTTGTQHLTQITSGLWRSKNYWNYHLKFLRPSSISRVSGVVHAL